MMWWLLFLAFAGAGSFDDGLRSFDEGHLEPALEAWESAGQDASVAMHYNAGVARYRQDDLPRAIAHWRRAAEMAPRNSDVGHNLALARSRTRGATSTPVAVQRVWMSFITPGELGGFGLLFVGLGSAGAVGWRRRRLDSPSVAAGAFAVGLLLTGVAISGAGAQQNAPVVVIVDAPAVVRDAAAVAASEVFELAPGSEVRVDDRLGDFFLVRTGDGRGGWISVSSAMGIGLR